MFSVAKLVPKILIIQNVTNGPFLKAIHQISPFVSLL